MVVDCWKQKAEDEERCARKPAVCRFFAPLVPMENKRKTEIGDRTKREREERMDRRRKESTDRWCCQWENILTFLYFNCKKLMQA